MRRFLIPALMISLLLTGCGGSAAGAEQKIEKQRDTLASSELMSFTADVTASLGEEAFQCTLACAATAEEITVEVVKPELIAGVRAHLRDGEAEVEYENVRLSLGGVATEGLHPISAMPILCKALKTGHIVRAWLEKESSGELVAAEIFSDENYGLTLWFDKSTLTPVHAELSETESGAVVITCDIRDFQYG